MVAWYGQLKQHGNSIGGNMDIREDYITGKAGYMTTLVALKQRGNGRSKCMDIAAGWTKIKAARTACTDLTREDCGMCPFAGTGKCPELY